MENRVWWWALWNPNIPGQPKVEKPAEETEKERSGGRGKPTGRGVFTANKERVCWEVEMGEDLDVAPWRLLAILTSAFSASYILISIPPTFIHNTVCRGTCVPRAMCSGENSDLGVKRPRSKLQGGLGQVPQQRGHRSLQGKMTRFDQIPKQRSWVSLCV